ncbi:MAG: lytic transglycosylase domain-containing protein [Peptococcia bacterium]
MLSSKTEIPWIFFLCTVLVFAAIFSYCELYQGLCQEKNSLNEQLIKIREEVQQLEEELLKIKRYAEMYGTTPEVIAITLRESEKYGITPTIMLELIKTESDFNPTAVSIADARGLCQIRPMTAKELCRELGVEYQQKKLFETEFNISLGAYYLAKLLKSYNGDYHRALTAYNRGPMGLENYMQSRGTAVSRYSQRISSRGFQLAPQSNQ